MPNARTPSEYDLVYESPPESVGGRPGPGRGPGKLYMVLEKLIADDNGQWAKITTCFNKSGASGLLTSIRSTTKKRNLPAPAEHFEFTTRTNTEANTSTLYARYIGEAGAAAAAAAVSDGTAPKRRGRPPKARVE